MTSRTKSFSVDQIQQLEIARNGSIMPRIRDLDYDSTLKGSLLSVLYPGIKVASVLVPVEPLDEVQEIQVRNAMANLVYRGVRYLLVGAASSAKKGLFYFVDEQHHSKIADRFHHWLKLFPHKVAALRRQAFPFARPGPTCLLCLVLMLDPQRSPVDALGIA